MLKIVSVPDKVLSQPTKAVPIIDDKIRKLIAEMDETLCAQQDPQGVGLSANQVGVPLSIFIMKKSPEAKTKIFINPKLLNSKIQNPKFKSSSKSKKKRSPVKLEGCLSIPRIWGPVKRAQKLHLEYQDLNSDKPKKEWFTGFEATIILHEMDHLNGIVFTQRSLEQKAPLYKESDGELKRFEI